MNEFYIKVIFSSDEITEVICMGRINNHDCWNTWVGDWETVVSGKNIKECKLKLRDYLIKQDKGLTTVEHIINNIRIDGIFKNTEEIDELLKLDNISEM
jgi:hypothetical protein